MQGKDLQLLTNNYIKLEPNENGAIWMFSFGKDYKLTGFDDGSVMLAEGAAIMFLSEGVLND